jgi:hypothetical protein
MAEKTLQPAKGRLGSEINRLEREKKKKKEKKGTLGDIQWNLLSPELKNVKPHRRDKRH